MYLRRDSILFDFRGDVRSEQCESRPNDPEASARNCALAPSLELEELACALVSPGCEAACQKDAGLTPALGSR